MHIRTDTHTTRKRSTCGQTSTEYSEQGAVTETISNIKEMNCYRVILISQKVKYKLYKMKNPSVDIP